MKIETVGWLLGVAWVGLAGLLLVPLGWALARAEPWLPFGIAAAGSAAIGAALLSRLHDAERTLDHRSALLAVSCIWLSMCGAGAVPFALYETPAFSLVDALFESTSGFTTTGATVISGLDTLPQSLLLWRSIMQWLGGMGMVILGVAILPLLGVGGMQLYKDEAPGPNKDQMTPRIAETARLLWLLYLGLSGVAAALFFGAGMSGFDALCHAMTAISTGGFSTHDASFGHFDSGSIRWVAIGVMVVGGTSFAVLHRGLTGGLRWSEQPELRAYVGILGLAAALITVDLLTSRSQEFATLPEALEHAAFQATSIMTGSGFATHDYAGWPGLSLVTLFGLLLVGGMAGSTTGGVKVIRVLLLARLAMAQFFRLLHPRAVNLVRLGDRTVEDEILMSSLGFLGMWLLLLVAGALLLSLWGADLVSSFSAAAASLGNVGPGFGEVGPGRTYAQLASAGQYQRALMTSAFGWKADIESATIIFAEIEVRS